MARIPEAGFRAACRLLTSHDVGHRLHEITAPTLVIVGELDEETPPAYAAVISEAISNCQLEVIPGAGHLSPAEAPRYLQPDRWPVLGFAPGDSAMMGFDELAASPS